jgi:argininosuccinate lyase
MIPAIICNREKMELAAIEGHTTATDLADYLVTKGIAFRDAHEIVGKAVNYAIEERKDLSELSLSELKRFSELITEDVSNNITLKGSVNARNHIGGTAISQVLLAVKAARKSLDSREGH